LYFSQAFEHGDLIIISSKLGTQQGNQLGGVLFVLFHLCGIHHIATTHLTCVFFSLADDTHIIGFASNVILISLQLKQKFLPLGLSM
jgi:hypothetical protein